MYRCGPASLGEPRAVQSSFCVSGQDHQVRVTRTLGMLPLHKQILCSLMKTEIKHGYLVLNIKSIGQVLPLRSLLQKGTAVHGFASSPCIGPSACELFQLERHPAL